MRDCAGSIGALARACLVGGALAFSGCSFDASPVPTGREHDTIMEGGHGGSARDSGRDAEPTPSVDAGPAPDARVPDMRDASTTPDAAPPSRPPDAGMDARPPETTPDAAPDATIDEEDDAMVDEPPDSGDECDDPDPVCVCPHDALGRVSDPCAPPLCDVALCAPDDHCRFLTFDDNGYYFCDDDRTWEQARNRCASVADLYLVTVESSGENAFIFENISDKTWLGGNDGNGPMQEGHWRWTDGREFYDDDEGPLQSSFVDWTTMEPNNAGLSDSPADCMMFWFDEGGWADASCGDLHPYVCEADP